MMIYLLLRKCVASLQSCGTKRGSNILREKCLAYVSPLLLEVSSSFTTAVTELITKKGQDFDFIYVFRAPNFILKWGAMVINSLEIWTAYSFLQEIIRLATTNYLLSYGLCPDFGVLCPAGGDAAIRTLEFVSNNFVEKISKKAKNASKDLKTFKKRTLIQHFFENCCIWNP
jgi:hypothetical protein